MWIYPLLAGRINTGMLCPVLTLSMKKVNFKNKVKASASPDAETMALAGPETDAYDIQVKGFCANFLVAAIVGVMASIFPLLLNQDAAIFYTSMPVYFSVVVLFVCVKLMGRWSVAAAFVMFALCSYLIHSPLGLPERMVNGGANLLQIIFFVVTIYFLRLFENKNKNMYRGGQFYLSFYNLCLIAVFGLYVAFCIAGKNVKVSPFAIWCFVVVGLLTLVKCIRKRDPFLFFYSIGIAFLPSLICSTISAYGTHTPAEELKDYIVQWTVSNYILLQTIGYVAYQILYRKQVGLFPCWEKVRFSLSAVLFYIALLFLNSAILFIIKEDLLKDNRYVYFFPWLFGNFFLCMNLYFSRFVGADSKDAAERFNWYERRVVVVEKNMSFIITIISFLLPLGFTSMHTIPPVAVVVFVANIFCACITLGLIWIPKDHIKFINLLKCVKTIFYIYSITLLLICSIMIIVQIAEGKQLHGAQSSPVPEVPFLKGESPGALH